MINSADILIIGGGIVGLATAYNLLLTNPDLQITLLEKEGEIATHQSGRNSGVIHSGIYYPHGSKKAIHCTQGKQLLRQFCKEEKIAYKNWGKLIIAIDESEYEQLERLAEFGRANQVEHSLINAAEIQEIEPYATGVAALHIPEAGVVSFREIAMRLAMRVQMMGGTILTNQEVTSIHTFQQGLIIGTAQGERFYASAAMNAAGLYADRLATMAGLQHDIKLFPFRGEYFRLRPQSVHLCKGLIYPVPNPELPFLGIHLTRTLHEEVECGPNAILAGSREGYEKGQSKGRDFLDHATSRRIRRLTKRYLHTAVWEMRRSWSKELFATTLQRLVPTIQTSDLQKAPSGIRAQAITPDGVLQKDFIWEETDKMIHILNTPSPGATACLSIGQEMASKLLAKLA